MNEKDKQRDFIEFREKLVRFMNDSISTRDGTGEIISADLDEQWKKLALDLFKLQYRYVQPYRNLCDYKLKSNLELDDWQLIPCVPTTAFKEFEITSLSQEERSAVFYSSGTTYERPSRHFHNEFSIKIYEESLSLWFNRCILKNKDKKFKLIFLTPSYEKAPHSSLVYMFKTLKERFGSEDSAFFGIADAQNIWKIDYDSLILELRNSESADNPIIVFGTAFNYVHLIDYLEDKRIKCNLPKDSLVFETGGYKGRSREIPKNELYIKITDYLGVSDSNIVSEYGMSELSSQAYDRIFNDEPEGERIFKFPPWARYSVVSPESKRPVKVGEAGILRIYDLANVCSVMAIQTDDIAIELGNGFALIGRAGEVEQRGCSLMAGM